MFALDATGPLRWWHFSFNAYDEVHGEPGGLFCSVAGPNTVNYGENRNVTPGSFDRMRISRYAIYLINEWDISEDTLFTFRAWWDYYYRFSRRQRGRRGFLAPCLPDRRRRRISWKPSSFTPGESSPGTAMIGAVQPDAYADRRHAPLQHLLPEVGCPGEQVRCPISDQFKNKSKRYTWYYSVFAGEQIHSW